MAITIKLGGVDKTGLLQKQKSLTWTHQENGRASGKLTLLDREGLFEPVDGMAVLIEEDGNERFAGVLVNPVRKQQHQGGPVTFACSLTDFAYLTDKRFCFLPKFTKKQTINVVVANMLTYLAANGGNEGLTMNNVYGEADTPHLPNPWSGYGLTFSELLTALVKVAEVRDPATPNRRWAWKVDSDLDIHLKPVEDQLAPATINTALVIRARLATYQARGDYRNRQHIIGGTADKTILATVEDAGEIAAREAIEVGTGIHESLLTVPDTGKMAPTILVAQGILEANVDLPVFVEVETAYPGFAPGQKATVHLPELGLVVRATTINTVTATRVPGTERLEYKITASTEGGTRPARPGPEWIGEPPYLGRPVWPGTGPVMLTNELDPADGDELRIPATAGAMVHDHPEGLTAWAGDPQSGALDWTPAAIGIDDDEAFMLTIRRGGVANSDGCGGGLFPGYGGSPNCNANRQTIVELYPITDHVVATSPTVGGDWDELAATSWKSTLVVEPKITGSSNRYFAFVQLGAPGVFGIATLAGVLVGSVATTMGNHGNGGEPVWLSNGYIMWPNVTDGKVFIFDARVPTAPIEVGSFATSLANLYALRVNSDETVMFGFGTGGIVSLDLTDPEALVEDDTLAPTGSYVSGAINADDDLIGCATRIDGNNVRVTMVDVDGSTIALNTENIVPLVQSAMLGTHAMLSHGSLIVWSAVNAVDGANSLEAQVFDVTAPDFVEHIETISYVHGAGGNIGPAISIPARAGIHTFGFNADAQVTHGDIVWDEVGRLVVDTPLREDFGGTGHGGPGDEYVKGESFYASDVSVLGKLAVGVDGSIVLADSGETLGVRTANRDFYNGTMLETFEALVTSDGATVTMSLEQEGGGDLVMRFSDGWTELDCDPAPQTIALTAGSDASPTENFIYIPQSTKVVTKDMGSWPATEHIKIAYFLVPSAGFVQTNGTYVNQNWNDHDADINNQGHMADMTERSRRLQAIYHSGVDGNGTAEYVTITGAGPSVVDFKSTAGVIYQMHSHVYPAKDTSGGDIVLVVNDSNPANAYDDITDLADLLTDADGDPMSGNYFNLVMWGVANKGGEFGPVMVNLPSGSYKKQADAEQDVDGEDVFVIPAAFKTESSTGFLICRITLKHSAAGGGTWTHVSTLDLRGLTPATAAGGSTGVTTTEFADNAFIVFDEGDPTKEIAFQASGISAGNTRVLTIQDADGTIMYVDGDHGGLGGRADDDHPGHLWGLGRAGSQTQYGGTAAGESYEVHSTIHATKGTINLGDTLYVDEVNGLVGFGIADPDHLIHAVKQGFVSLAAVSYSDSVAHRPGFLFQKSHSDIVGTLVRTIDTEHLGAVNFQGTVAAPAFNFGAVIYAVQDGATGGRVPANLIFETYDSAAVNASQLFLHHDGNVGISEDLPSALLTTNQGAADGEIWAAKSSDIATGMTDEAETDTYAAFQKIIADSGGLRILGLSEVGQGIQLMAGVATNDTTKDTATRAQVEVYGTKQSGTALAGPDADAAIFGVRSASTTHFIADSSGNTWQSGDIAAVGAVLTGVATIGGPATVGNLAGSRVLMQEPTNETAPLGADLVTNGAFTTNLDDWAAGAGWAWDTATALHTPGNVAVLSQSIVTTSGQTYVVEYDIIGRTAGNVVLTFGSAVGSYTSTADATGIQTTFEADGAAEVLTFTPHTDFDGAIDNVIVKQITGGTDAAIVIYDGGNAVAVEARTGGQGLFNLALGYQSLYFNTIGSYNIAIGVQALYSNTVGRYNAAFGPAALFANTTGRYNIALGSIALYSNITGSQNAAIGYQALFANTTGGANIAIGDQAGRYHADGSTPLTDPENSVYIGASCKGKDNSDSNSIVIGHNAIGKGANTVVLGNTSIVETYLQGKVVISGDLDHDGSNIGLFATAPAAQQTITGARDVPEEALADLLTKLALYGLVIDSTTAS